MALRHARAIALACALAAAVSIGVASPASAVDYPSWDDVQAAQGNEAATASTIATISSLLDSLQAEAARLGDAAVVAQADAQTARTELDRARAEATSLASRADAAAARADRSAARAAQIAVALYRSGGSDLTGTLLLTRQDSSDELLYRLGALDRVGGQLTIALEAAESDRNEADALSAQADVAAAERDRLSQQADATAATAQAASDAADAAVAVQQASLTQLYEQLATLKNTTVELEQQYRIGQQTSGGGPTAGGSSGGSGGGSSDGGAISVPGSDVNNPTAARYFAFAQLSAMGFGEEQYSCILWLWNRESGWRTNAYNASSGAYGIPQSLPGSKMAAVGADWRTNYETQVRWGLIYIQNRYGSPCGAWAHSEDVGWY